MAGRGPRRPQRTVTLRQARRDDTALAGVWKANSIVSLSFRGNIRRKERDGNILTMVEYYNLYQCSFIRLITYCYNKDFLRWMLFSWILTVYYFQASDSQSELITRVLWINDPC